MTDLDSSRWPPAPPDGDIAAAFSCFYRRDMPKLVAFLVWLGARPADAVEIAQDAMTQVFQRWGDLTAPRAWSRKVAGRAYARRLTDLLEVPVDNPAVSVSPLPDPSGIDAIVDKHEVVALFTQLPLRQRHVMALTFDGYTPAEIAVELGMKSDAVRASLYKARATLARLRRGIDPG
ncbi:MULTISPECIES: sigma-70 family RNA polymerase sigma factor [unclassified Frankia]|uniref:sigma-70 family RNA polymerase sigma factor n=1 Tax=unclassified Frankia TaxID=2632575 RepID=UPI002AD4C040|nr:MULTISPECIES: sigma-70 family RNA polymerase sigma factor [unclassified Frankia]